jgi:hypothetical protein
MSRTDDIADEIAAAITARISDVAHGPNGTEVRIDGRRLHLDSIAFREEIERTYFQEYRRGIRPGMRAQIARNVAAWCRFGPPNGGDVTEEPRG